MSRERLFIDTAFIQAVLNPRDEHYNLATAINPRVENAKEIWVTELVLAEVGDALSRINRAEAYQFIDSCYNKDNYYVVSVDKTLLRRGLELYRSRPDKSWGLTDCVSFVVMGDANLSQAVTTDRHFVQAGFRALLLEK